MSRKRVLLTGTLLLIVGFVGVDFVSRILFAPWSIGYFGRETLTGEWVGSLRAQQGAQFALYLDLEYQGRESSYRGSGPIGPSNNLTGRATLCAPTGERYEYEVSGFATRSGLIEDLWLEYGDPALSGLNLRISGELRPSALHLVADANPFLPDGSFLPARPSSSDDPDDSFAPFELSNGEPTALEAACSRIRS